MCSFQNTPSQHENDKTIIPSWTKQETKKKKTSVMFFSSQFNFEAANL